MRVEGEHYRTVWPECSRGFVRIIDQRQLPWRFVVEDLASVTDVANAIRDMHVTVSYTHLTLPTNREV